MLPDDFARLLTDHDRISTRVVSDAELSALRLQNPRKQVVDTRLRDEIPAIRLSHAIDADALTAALANARADALALERARRHPGALRRIDEADGTVTFFRAARPSLWAFPFDPGERLDELDDWGYDRAQRLVANMLTAERYPLVIRRADGGLVVVDLAERRRLAERGIEGGRFVYAPRRRRRFRRRPPSLQALGDSRDRRLRSAR